MLKGLIRLLAFFGKEMNEVRRQPRLVLSLLLGPFLILLLFGIGYQGERPLLKTALVVSQDRLNDPRLESIKQNIQANFQLVSIDSDYDAARQRLEANQIDVLEQLPADLEQRVLLGERSVVKFEYNEINPLNEQWIQYLSYAQVNELNKTILADAAGKIRQEAAATKQLLTQLRSQIDAFSGDLSSVNRAQLQQSVRQLRAAGTLLAVSPLVTTQVVGQAGDASQTQTQLLRLQESLDALDASLNNGTLEQQQQQIQQVRERLGVLEDVTNRISTLQPDVVVSPLQEKYQNIRGPAYDFMTYYAPGVLALIVQHIAVTLGALSLVRERLLGAIEFYGVAPVWLTQVLLGKYLAYTLFIAIIVAALVGLMLLLQVPFLGSVLVFGGLVVLFTLAALGIGFLISALSTSDSQAVQLSMLVLLLSIFFSGFFLPLENFVTYIQPIGYALPLTHGIKSFQDIMLRGKAPGVFEWSALGAIAGVTFVAVMLIWRRQFRRID